MYNMIYTYLTENEMVFDKQFGFKASHSIDHARVEPAIGQYHSSPVSQRSQNK